jgi:hypothetical protein
MSSIGPSDRKPNFSQTERENITNQKQPTSFQAQLAMNREALTKIRKAEMAECAKKGLQQSSSVTGSTESSYASFMPINKSSPEVQKTAEKTTQSFWKALGDRVSKFFKSFYDPIRNFFFGSSNSSIEGHPLRSEKNEKLIQEALDALRDTELEGKSVCISIFDTGDEGKFKGIFRSFERTVREFKNLGNRQNVTFKINDTVIQDHTGVEAKTQLKAFFYNPIIDAQTPDIHNPADIGKYIFNNGIGNIVGDNKSTDSPQYKKETKWFQDNGIIPEVKRSEIEFYKDPGDIQGVYKIRTDETYDLKNFSTGKIIGQIRVEKDYVVEQQTDRQIKIEVQKKVSKINDN